MQILSLSVRSKWFSPPQISHRTPLFMPTMATWSRLETFSALAVLFVIAYTIYGLLKYRPGASLPKIPIIGAKSSDWFPVWQAALRNTRNYRQAVTEAYASDNTVLIPTLDSGILVHLPTKDIQWIIDQPDSVLSMHASALDGLRCDYTMPNPRLTAEPVHTKLITTTLTREIGNLVPDLADETEAALTEGWGTDTTEWKEITVFKSTSRIVGRLSNRVFIGTPLCRDDEVLSSGIMYANLVAMTANVLNLLPVLIRPVIAVFLTIPIKLTARKFVGKLAPHVKERLNKYDTSDKKPNDFLQWSIAQAKTFEDPYFSSPKTLSERILILNFAAIHTSTFNITHTLIDLVSSRPEYIAELRAEIESCLAEQGGQWNKFALARMVKIDSTFRESGRKNSFTSMGIARIVVSKDGVVTPDGVHVKAGNRVCTPSYVMMQDDAVYSSASEFHPFRFVREEQKKEDGTPPKLPLSFATTSNQYLHFGHGKYACPGRFFAANELKLLLAFMILNYDFEMQDVRPQNAWFGAAHIPPMAHTIRVRRRAAVKS